MTARRSRSLARPAGLTGTGTRFPEARHEHTARPARSTHGVQFAELGVSPAGVPMVLAEIGGELVEWSSDLAAWTCTCGQTTKLGNGFAACSHSRTVAGALPTRIACQLATAMVRAGPRIGRP